MKKFLIVFLVFSFFLFLSSTLAENGEGEPLPEEPPAVVCGSGEDSWTVYSCASEGVCGGEIWGQNFWTSWWACSDGGGGSDSGQSDPYLVEKCSPYQVCSGGNSPSCVCKGSCYPAPTLNPLSSVSKNVFDSSGKVKLPVKLDWQDLDVSPCTVESYRYQINGAATIGDSVAASEVEMKDCRLKSNANYAWQVEACLGSDCGAWSSPQDFSTSLAPEPVSPYDPDWTGPTGAEGVDLPAKLDWCDVGEAQSYRFKIYIIEGGKKVCHPDLLSTAGGKEICDSWLLRKTRRDPQQAEKILYSDFLDENMDFFTKNTEYAWQATICDENGFNCKIDSQLWTFSTKEVALAASFLVGPTNDPTGKTPVGLPVVLDWNDKPGANSFIYEIAPATSGQQISENTNVSQSKSFNFPLLSLNTLYKWKVKSCWDYESKKCEPNFSEEWYFKTTGQAPILTTPSSEEQNVVIPVKFQWQAVPGAKSYVLKVDGLLEKTLDKTEFPVDFPEYPISQETNYSWQVKTCAWDEGKTCGQYGNPQTFRTFRLPPPQSPSPGNNGQFFTGDTYVSWEKVPGAKAYQYQMKYLSLAEKEIDETCPALVGKDLFEQPKIVLANSDFLEPKCLGGYQWQVRSCLDNNCQEVSNWSTSWSFTFLEGGTGQNGLVPCGRSTDDPKTSWNEREPCQIKHLFLIVKIIIDFLLFRIIPLILVLLTIATGIIFYTSFGQVMTMAQIISLWKAAGIGLVIIFFAWTIVNLFLKAIGYNIGIFGNWFQLPF